MLTPFEIAYLLTERCQSQLRVRARKDIRTLVERRPDLVRLLDIGARKSYYTIGIPARVTLLDLPRESELQEHLRLGATQDILRAISKRRSNVVEYRIEDFLSTTLPNEAFDLLVAVEVLEHIQDDRAFVIQAERVLSPGGYFYATTPNGAIVPRKNPDHVRHYTAESLRTLLLSGFPEVKIGFGERRNRFLRGTREYWQPRRPHVTLGGMVANFVVNVAERLYEATEDDGIRLIAIARKFSAPDFE